MNADELWRRFQAEKSIGDVPYEAWSFGGAPDELAELVIQGKKTATSSLYHWYEGGEERLPQAGDYSVVLDARGNAVCIIQTTKVDIVPFCDVSGEHAQREGEGDLSLAYWRQVHKEFFSGELEAEHRAFSETMDVVCEVFQLMYTA